MNKASFFLLVFFTSAGAVFCQTSSDKNIGTKISFDLKCSHRLKKAIKKQSDGYVKYLSEDTAVLNRYTVQSMLDEVECDKSGYYIFVCQYWMANHYKEMIPELIRKVTDTTLIGLNTSMYFNVSERVFSGEMKPVREIYWVDDDLFTIAGRANYLLSEITGEYFGYVSSHSTCDELKALQQKWINWLDRINRRNKHKIIY